MKQSPMTDRERRAFNKGLETAARLAKLYADENFRMCNDTILHDPILSRKPGKGKPTAAEVETSERLGYEGHGHAHTGHACHHLAAMIRGQKVKPPNQRERDD